jgi:hydrogenase maturation protease
MNAFLVIGYGNTLRRDDGAGPRVAEKIGAMNLPGVSVYVCHQLTPEIADVISQSEGVVFVDAAVNATGVELREIQPQLDGRILAHATDPRSLLGLAGQLFGDQPRAWTLAIPAEDFGYGDEMSPRTQEACRTAVGQIQTLASLMHAGRLCK